MLTKGYRKPLDAVATRIAVDLGLFNVLVESRVPISSQEIAKRISIDVTLLRRILRYLAGRDAVAYASPDSYIATKISRAFTTTKGVSASKLL